MADQPVIINNPQPSPPPDPHWYDKFGPGVKRNGKRLFLLSGFAVAGLEVPATKIYYDLRAKYSQHSEYNRGYDDAIHGRDNKYNPQK